MGLFDQPAGPSLFSLSNDKVTMSKDTAKELFKDKPKGGIFSTRIYSPGKNVEVTVHKDAYGNIDMVSCRDLWLGIF